MKKLLLLMPLMAPIAISSLLATFSITFASLGVAKGDANTITPLYKECLMHIVMETGEWSEECEAEMKRRQE